MMMSFHGQHIIKNRVVWSNTLMQRLACGLIQNLVDTSHVVVALRALLYYAVLLLNVVIYAYVLLATVNGICLCQH